MGGSCSTLKEVRNAYRILVENPNGRDHEQEPGMDERKNM
jgi:hypothetical protein